MKRPERGEDRFQSDVVKYVKYFQRFAPGRAGTHAQMLSLRSVTCIIRLLTNNPEVRTAWKQQYRVWGTGWFIKGERASHEIQMIG